MLLAAVVVAAHSALAGLEVRLTDPRGQPAAGEVVAEPTGSLGEGLAARQIMASGGSVVLTLGPGLWSIRARVAGRWCAPVQVQVRDGLPTPSSVTLMLWPVGRLTGAVKAPSGAGLPARLTLRLHRDLKPREYLRARPLDSIECPLAAGRWSCEVPASLPLDLEIDAAPFAPRYLWQVAVAEGATRDTGTLTLFRGASVAGFVLDEKARPWQPHASVELTAPDGETIRPALGSNPGLSTTTDERGFFQVGPVPPGAYHVQASAAAHVSEPAWVRLTADTEERLAEPLELVPPVTLRVQVSPGLDPSDRPWRIHLLTWRGQHSGHRLAKGEPVAEDGTWSRASLPAGDNYRLTVASSGGDIWASRRLGLHGGTVHERVVLERLELQGSVSMATEPLTGRVQLKDENSGASAWFRMDELGDFSGSFASVDLAAARWAAQIESSKPLLRRRLTGLRPDSADASRVTFRLRLGNGAIEGTVVDESGSPQEGVLVEATEHELEAVEQSSASGLDVRTSADGSFRLQGLTPAKYRLVAMGHGGQAGYESVSDVVSVTVSGSRPAVARLVLRSSLTLRGRVVTPTGTPVAGATVVVGSSDSPEVPARPRTTDSDGGFDAKIPAGTRQLVLMVWAQGVGRRVLGRSLPADGKIQVELNPLGGGEIVLALGQPELDLSSVWVYHDGGFDHVRALAVWAAQNGATEQGGVLRFPLMDPGHYRVCRLRGLFEYAAFMAGALGKERCRTGDLPPAGELHLDLPAPVAPAP